MEYIFVKKFFSVSFMCFFMLVMSKIVTFYVTDYANQT